MNFSESFPLHQSKILSFSPQHSLHVTSIHWSNYSLVTLSLDCSKYDDLGFIFQVMQHPISSDLLDVVPRLFSGDEDVESVAHAFIEKAYFQLQAKGFIPREGKYPVLISLNFPLDFYREPMKLLNFHLE